MLELAAKAAGFDDAEFDSKTQSIITAKLPGLRCFWNPLTDDGDALRLAVKLQMSLSLGPCRTQANTIDGVLRNAWFEEEIIHQDAGYAARRAIVRAAAEIGKETK